MRTTRIRQIKQNDQWNSRNMPHNQWNNRYIPHNQWNSRYTPRTTQVWHLLLILITQYKCCQIWAKSGSDWLRMMQILFKIRSQYIFGTLWYEKISFGPIRPTFSPNLTPLSSLQHCNTTVTVTIQGCEIWRQLGQIFTKWTNLGLFKI